MNLQPSNSFAKGTYNLYLVRDDIKFFTHKIGSAAATRAIVPAAAARNKSFHKKDVLLLLWSYYKQAF